MQQHPYGAPPPYGSQYGPPPHEPPPSDEKKPNVAMAAFSVAFGLFSLFLPIPFLDVAFGVAGIVLSALAMRSGIRALAVAGMVLSIMGTQEAFFFTLGFLGRASGEWVLMLQLFTM